MTAMKKTFLFRVLFYILGLLFLAFSVAFATNSNLGVSPVSSVPYAISLVSNVRMGTCVTGVFCVYILLQYALLRRKFQWYNIFQIAFSTVFGFFTDFARSVLGGFCLPGYAGRLAMLCISILFISIGISFYVDVRLIPMPFEGLTGALAECFHVKFHNMKTILDCASILLAALIALLFLGGLQGVREGTLISALLTGRMVAVMQKWVEPTVNRLCFPGKESGR